MEKDFNQLFKDVEEIKNALIGGKYDEEGLCKKVNNQGVRIERLERYFFIATGFLIAVQLVIKFIA